MCVEWMIEFGGMTGNKGGQQAGTHYRHTILFSAAFFHCCFGAYGDASFSVFFFFSIISFSFLGSLQASAQKLLLSHTHF